MDKFKDLGEKTEHDQMKIFLKEKITTQISDCDTIIQKHNKVFTDLGEQVVSQFKTARAKFFNANIIPQPRALQFKFRDGPHAIDGKNSEPDFFYP